jgi:hypothetical protein
MKPLFLMTASALAMAGLAACTPSGRPAARAALECPEQQGQLHRTGISGDHKTCTYRAEDGGEVTLQLVSTGGDPITALKGVETTLLAPAPGAAAEPAKAEAAPKPDAAKADEAEKVAKEAKADAGKAGGWDDEGKPDQVDVDLPGVHVRANDGHGDKDQAHIDLPGIHINANDETDQADIRVGGVTVNAQDDNVTVRVYREVRLRGEALSAQKRGLRASYFYTGKSLPVGYRFVGYEAGGPKAGPITVATVRSNAEGDVHGGVYNDIKRLVRKNGGV